MTIRNGQKRIGDPLDADEDEERADLHEQEPWEDEGDEDMDPEDM